MKKTIALPRYVKVLLLFTAANLIILAIRNTIVGDQMFDFLKSNLFSGILPLVIAILMQLFFKRINSFWFVVASLVWLVFYPNSPYMISDLIHPHEEALDQAYPTLIVYDTFIVFSIAMLSLFYGFVSLKLIFGMYTKRFGRKTAHYFIIFSLILSCLGFYIGRELKSGTDFGNGYLYSWQLFTEPIFILKTIWKHLFPIHEHMNAYYMMLLFGFVQYQMLIMMKDVKDIEEGEVITKDEFSPIIK